MSQCAPTEEVNLFLNNYIKPNDTKAWTALGISLLIEAVALALIFSPLSLMGWVLHTLNMVRFFIQFHDMAHFSFFSSIAANKAVGRMIGIYVNFPFDNWRDGHNHHHKHFGNLDRTDLSQTILFTKKQYEEMKTPLKLLVRILREPVIFFTITVQIVWYFGVFFNCIRRYGVLSSAVADKVISFAMYLFIFDWIGLPAWGMYWSLHISMSFGTILFHLQHSVNAPYREHQKSWNFARAALEGSTFLQIPLLLRPFTNGIEYHHIHHLNTNVASYVIQTCHDEFEHKDKTGLHWDKYHINRVDWPLACRSLLNVMLDEETGTLLPFSYTSL
jgi:omega-6 fatty acid desaturase (delta-12 desaturase)